jgi:hypothetical protein
MALGEQVKNSLEEAEGSLRNALAYAARQERPLVCSRISQLIQEIDNIQSFDGILDKLEDRKFGDKGSFGTFFDDVEDL